MINSTLMTFSESSPIHLLSNKPHLSALLGRTIFPLSDKTQYIIGNEVRGAGVPEANDAASVRDITYNPRASRCKYWMPLI